MKPAYYILLLCACICTISGCSEEYTPVNSDSVREAVLIAELEVGKDIEMTLSSTFSNTEQAYFPTHDELGSDNIPRLSNLDPNGQKNVTLRNLSEDQLWISESFRFKEGDEISISANLEVVGMSNIYATTRVPIAGSILETSDRVELTDSGEYKFSVQFGDLNHEEDYYHIIPFTTSSATSVSNDFVDFSVTTEGGSRLLKPSHMDGMLIDINRSDADSEFIFTIPSSELSSSNPSHIYLKLKTVTKEYYDYHKSLTFQLESQQGPFDAPVPTVSNVESGQGLFTAYTASMESIPVN